MLHTFSSEADIHLRDEDTMVFGYHDGGRHAVDAKIHSNLVMVGIASLVDDFIGAVVSFLSDLEVRTADPSEKLVIETRLAKTLGIVPFNSGDPG